MENIQWYIGGLGLSIIAYFLKKTMDELKETKENFIEVNKKVAIIERESLLKDKHIEEKFDTLQVAIKDLTVSIKELNNELKKKN